MKYDRWDVRINISGKSAEARNIAEQALVANRQSRDVGQPSLLAVAADVVLTY